MKIKKFIPIALLAASLMLTSCDDLLGNLMGGGNKKSSDNDTNENQQGYQGKQGSTQLSKEEWELAFSLEEFVLRRNCHLEVTQEQTQMKMDVDNGKFKVEVPYSNQPVYVHFTGVDANKNISGTSYYPNNSGGYDTASDTEPLDLTMTEFGLIYLEYDSFKYDSSSKMYKADNYHYEVKYQGRTALSLDCSDCKVTIEDGFPKKLECNIVSGGDGQEEGEEPMHYVAEYSRYNAINVTLPDVGNNNGNGNGGNNGGNNTKPTGLGEEIPFSEFYQAFVNRPEETYNHVEITANSSSGELSGQETIEATYVYGMWESDNEGFSSDTVESLILTEETLVEMRAAMGQVELSFYHDAKNETYAYYYYYEMVDYNIAISATVVYNKSFYAISEIADMMGVNVDMTAKWSNVNVSNRIMNVSNRTFVGADIQETTLAYYEGYKATVESMTVSFDTDGKFKMSVTKMNSGNVVADTYLAYYGTYQQSGNSVVATVEVYNDGENLVDLPTEQQIAYRFTVNNDQLIMATVGLDENNQQVDIHAIFEFDGAFNDNVEYPTNEENGNNNSSY